MSDPIQVAPKNAMLPPANRMIRRRDLPRSLTIEIQNSPMAWPSLMSHRLAQIERGSAAVAGSH